ncbi:hypothetical protein [Streptomyces sp. NPDC006997]
MTSVASASATRAPGEHFPVHVYGGPTALFEYGGLRFRRRP